MIEQMCSDAHSITLKHQTLAITFLLGFNTYSKVKWKGSQMMLQLAKDSFLDRYSFCFIKGSYKQSILFHYCLRVVKILTNMLHSETTRILIAYVLILFIYVLLIFGKEAL